MITWKIRLRAIDTESQQTHGYLKHTRKRPLHLEETTKKEATSKAKAPFPSLLEQPQQVPISSEEFALKDFPQPPVATCNMASINAGNPRPCGESHPTPTVHGSTVVIDWLQNNLTY